MSIPRESSPIPLGEAELFAQRQAFDELKVFVEQRESTHNLVQLPVIRIDERTSSGLSIFDGTVHCVASALTTSGYGEPVNRLYIEDTDLVREHAFPDAQVHAVYVGLWPTTSIATLYDITTEVTIAPEILRKPFQEVVTKILDNPQHGLGYHVIDPANSLLVINASTSLPVIATAGTQLHTEQTGIDTISRPRKEQWQIDLSGQGIIDIPSDAYRRVTTTSILQNVACAGVAIDFSDGSLPQTSVTIMRRDGDQPIAISLAGDGKIKIDNANTEYTSLLQPKIKAEHVPILALDVTWSDITAQVLRQKNVDLIAAMAFDSQTLRERIFEAVLSRLDEVRPGTKPSVMGIERVRQYINNLDSRSSERLPINLKTLM